MSVPSSIYHNINYISNSSYCNILQIEAKMVGYSLSTVAAITAMSGSVAAFTPNTRSITTTTSSSSLNLFSSIRLCGACSQSTHGNACKCSSCSRMSHSVSYVCWWYAFVMYYMIIAQV